MLTSEKLLELCNDVQLQSSSSLFKKQKNLLNIEISKLNPANPDSDDDDLKTLESALNKPRIQPASVNSCNPANASRTCLLM